jgi:hypothetical protein
MMPDVDRHAIEPELSEIRAQFNPGQGHPQTRRVSVLPQNE